MHTNCKLLLGGFLFYFLDVGEVVTHRLCMKQARHPNYSFVVPVVVVNQGSSSDSP